MVLNHIIIGDINHPSCTNQHTSNINNNKMKKKYKNNILHIHTKSKYEVIKQNKQLVIEKSHMRLLGNNSGIILWARRTFRYQSQITTSSRRTTKSATLTHISLK